MFNDSMMSNATEKKIKYNCIKTNNKVLNKLFFFIYLRVGCWMPPRLYTKT